MNEWQITNLPAAYILLGLFSLAIGSFLNVLIYRLPNMLYTAWINEHSAPEITNSITNGKENNLFFPRSFCPCCKVSIPIRYNIPVVAYFLLRGKCHHCRKAISFRYPLVEILSCLFALFSAWHFGFNAYLVYSLMFIWILIALFFIDLEHQLLPDSLTLSLLWLGLIANTESLFISLPNAVLSAVGAYLSLWFFIKLFYLLTGKVGMGNGDFKLFAAFGAWFGWNQLPFILLLASSIGAIIGIIYLKSQGKSNNTPIPFGPFLCISGLIALFYGQEFVNWYLKQWL